MFAQVATEFNRAKHVHDNDVRPPKRPFTLVELQQFFDLADDHAGLEFDAAETPRGTTFRNERVICRRLSSRMIVTNWAPSPTTFSVRDCGPL